MRVVLCCFFLLGLGLVSAQNCGDELREGLDGGALEQTASGLDAVRLLKRTVDLLEPVLPQLVNTPDYFPLTFDDEGFDEAKFLAQRGLLPPSWGPGELRAEAWRSMLLGVADWYRLRGFEPAASTGELQLGTLIGDLERLIMLAKPKLRPVALVATEAPNQGTVAFWAIIRKSSVFPRLIVMRPPGADVRIQGGVRSLLPLMETCAFEVDDFISASADTARRLFSENFDRVDMYVASTAPVRMDGFSRVPPGQETPYLMFQSEALAPFDTYAAAFYGAGVGFATVLRLFPQVQTNMNPREIMQFAFPGH